MIHDFNLMQSMSGTGNCYDNTFAESFIHTIKIELIYDKNYKTKAEANASIFEYIETFCNSKKIHSGINYKTPNEFEIEFKEEQRLYALRLFRPLKCCKIKNYHESSCFVIYHQSPFILG